MKVNTLRKTVATGVLAAFGGLAAAQTAAPASDLDPVFEDFAVSMQASTDKYCNPALDGDKSKGEITNADIGNMVRRAGSIHKQFPDISEEAVIKVFMFAAMQGHTFCVNKEVQQLTAEHLPPPARPLLADRSFNAVAFVGADVIALNPTPVDAKDPLTSGATALFMNLMALGTWNQRMNLGPNDVVPTVMLYNKANPLQSGSGPAPGVMQVMTTPPVKVPGAESTPPAGKEPTPKAEKVRFTAFGI